MQRITVQMEQASHIHGYMIPIALILVTLACALTATGDAIVPEVGDIEGAEDGLPEGSPLGAGEVMICGE